MPPTRLLVAAGLLAALALGAVAVAAWTAGEAGEAGVYPLEVMGPDGPLFSGAVEDAEGTALSVLLAGARGAGLAVELREYPGMGAYVASIGGHEARGAEGWVYEVGRDGAWASGDRSAERFALRNGDALRWSWSGEG